MVDLLSSFVALCACGVAGGGHADVPGVVIDHLDAKTRQYVGSPGIAVLRDGSYVASHDVFGPGSSWDTTRVFRSEDRGANWRHLTDIKGQFWSSLFVHRGALYIMGSSKRYGFVVIRRSTDGGETWTTPNDGTTGRLTDEEVYHTAPVPVVVHRGRIWRAMEYRQRKGGGGFGTALEIDEVRLYNRALSVAELAAIVPGELSR